MNTEIYAWNRLTLESANCFGRHEVAREGVDSVLETGTDAAHGGK